MLTLVIIHAQRSGGLEGPKIFPGGVGFSGPWGVPKTSAWGGEGGDKGQKPKLDADTSVPKFKARRASWEDCTKLFNVNAMKLDRPQCLL